MKNKSIKEQFKLAYRLARQPDRYLACDIDGKYRFVLDSIPLGIFKLAEICLESRGV